MSATDPVKASWQSAASGAAGPPSLDAVRAGADLFHRRIRRRNRIEYAASAVVLIVFSAYVLYLPGPLVKLGSALVVLGALVMLWQFRRRAAATPPPECAGVAPLLAHQRAQLVRQRDALASVFLWYELPFLPGLTLMMVGLMLGQGWRREPASPAGGLIGLAVIVAVFVGIWWLNRIAARKLQRHIDEIDRLAA